MEVKIVDQLPVQIFGQNYILQTVSWGVVTDGFYG